MKNSVKQGALALAVLGSAALFAAPAVANSLHDEGDFGGGYRIIGPSGGPERYDYVRHHTFRPYYYGPVDPYGYAPGWNYYYGPGIGLWGPNVVIGY
ncbi:MAG: hypothetical protein WBE89_14695 [Methyloceanibacter sp.]|jgi:hypothetical protein